MKKVLQQIGEVLESSVGSEHFSITGKEGLDIILQTNHDDGACSYHTAKYKDGKYSDLEFKGYDEKGDIMSLEYRYKGVTSAVDLATKR